MDHSQSYPGYYPQGMTMQAHSLQRQDQHQNPQQHQHQPTPQQQPHRLSYPYTTPNPTTRQIDPQNPATWPIITTPTSSSPSTFTNNPMHFPSNVNEQSRQHSFVSSAGSARPGRSASPYSRSNSSTTSQVAKGRNPFPWTAECHTSTTATTTTAESGMTGMIALDEEAWGVGDGTGRSSRSNSGGQSDVGGSGVQSAVPGGGASVSGRRGRLPNVCDTCRNRKIGCPGGNPCSRCIRDNRPCVYTSQPLRTSLTRARMTQLEERNLLYEKIWSNLFPTYTLVDLEAEFGHAPHPQNQQTQTQPSPSSSKSNSTLFGKEESSSSSRPITYTGQPPNGATTDQAIEISMRKAKKAFWDEWGEEMMAERGMGMGNINNNNRKTTCSSNPSRNSSSENSVIAQSPDLQSIQSYQNYQPQPIMIGSRNDPSCVRNNVPLQKLQTEGMEHGIVKVEEQDWTSGRNDAIPGSSVGSVEDPNRNINGLGAARGESSGYSAIRNINDYNEPIESHAQMASFPNSTTATTNIDSQGLSQSSINESFAPNSSRAPTGNMVTFPGNMGHGQSPSTMPNPEAGVTMDVWRYWLEMAAQTGNNNNNSNGSSASGGNGDGSGSGIWDPSMSNIFSMQ